VRGGGRVDNFEAPAGGAPAFHGIGSLKLHGGCNELFALHRRYPGVTFISVKVWQTSPRFLLEKASSIDIIDVRLNLRGAAADLIRYGFMHPTWVSLPAHGSCRHRCESFGTAYVHLLKGGQYALRWALLDHALDLLSPALFPLYWSPPAR
jgi:hypothetical protein